MARREHRQSIEADLLEEYEDELEQGRWVAEVRFFVRALESVADWWIGAIRAGPRAGGLGIDLRFAARSLGREPVVSGALVLSIGVAVAASVSITALIRGIVLRPLPFPEPDRIVELSRTSDGVPSEFRVVGLPDLEDWRRSSTSFEALAGWSSGGVTWQSEAGTRILWFGRNGGEA